MCLDCGKEKHEGGACQKTCVNCGLSGHSCMSRKECGEWRKAKEICTIKTDLDISYGQAKQMYESRNRVPTSQPFSGVVRSEMRVEGELKEKVDKMEKQMNEMMEMMKVFIGRKARDDSETAEVEERGHGTVPQRSQETVSQIGEAPKADDMRGVEKVGQGSEKTGSDGVMSSEREQDKEGDVVEMNSEDEDDETSHSTPTHTFEWRKAVGKKKGKSTEKRHEISDSDDSISPLCSSRTARSKEREKRKTGQHEAGGIRRSWK